ncbi:T9SS type A sorting domain-containing protein [bacterium]
MLGLRSRQWLIGYVFVFLTMTNVLSSQETFPGMIGVDLGSLMTRGGTFVDAAKTLREWDAVNGVELSKDDKGWPLTDAKTVFFDMRPTFAWTPPIDDPEAYQVDVSGTYKLSFIGQAELSSAEGVIDIANQVYDENSNRSFADVTVPAGEGLLYMSFMNTRAHTDSALNTGIRDVKLIRPGYQEDTVQIFTDGFLSAIAPFGYIRFMDWFSMNNELHAPFDENEPIWLNWEDRKQLDDATQLEDKSTGCVGPAWEYLLELANQSGQNFWINIPIGVDDDYIQQLASFLNTGLEGNPTIYIEYSNEVWNYGFPQSSWNLGMAQVELASGTSGLDYDGKSDDETIRHRRYAHRLMEIVNVFISIFGQEQIKGVLAWWKGQGVGNFEDMLNYINDNYGPPNQIFYAIATTGYFGYSDGKADDEHNVDDILSANFEDAVSDAASWVPFNELAATWNLKHVVYEGGESSSPGISAHTIALANRIMAARDIKMGDIIDYHIRHHWFGQGEEEVGEFTYFTLCGAYSRYGTYGLTDDINLVNRNYKYPAIMTLLGKHVGIPRQPVDVIAIAADSRVELSWWPIAMTELYMIQRSQSVEGPFISVYSTSALSYVDTVDNNQIYYYQIVAENSMGSSIPSDIVSATPRGPVIGERGAILREVWSNIPGSDITSLMEWDQFPNFPDFREELRMFETENNLDDRYGARFRGWIHPPETGEYSFFIAADDRAELWLSSDSTELRKRLIASNPNKTKQYQWDKYDTQTSAIQSFDSGKKYYIEALHKENVLSDVFAVAWSGPNINQQVIDGVFLSPVIPDGYISDIKFIYNGNQHHLPTKLTLFSNFPNPFNQQSVIRYKLSAGSKVQIKVFDVRGKEVVSLINKRQELGNHQVRFDGSNYPSGIYLVELRAGDQVVRQKIMLLK